MKTRLLKKVRRRFDWRINSEGYPVVIDKKRIRVISVDVDWCKDINKFTDEDVKREVKVTMEEWCWRWAKTIMLRPFGYDWSIIRDRTNYRRNLSWASKRKNYSKR